MSYRRFSLLSVAVCICAGLSRAFDLVVDVAARTAALVCMPFAYVIRMLASPTLRHSIGVPKIIAFRFGRLLKPVYRESFRCFGRNIMRPPLRC